jgi:AcrR family transcriptional regulator
MEYIFFDENSGIKGINMPKSRIGFEKMRKLCEAAETLFFEKGFYETSITDIAKSAQTAVGTFYTYFNDKTAIYNYLVKNYYVVIHKHLSLKTAECKTRIEMEHEGLKEFIRFGQQNPQCYKIIWGASHVDPALFEGYYTNFARGYIAALKKYEGGLIDADLSTIVWCLMGITSFIALKVIFSHKPISERKLDRLADDVMKVLCGGIFKQSDREQTPLSQIPEKFLEWSPY